MIRLPYHVNRNTLFPDPGRSSPRGSSSPLGGSCYPRRKPSLPAARAGAAPHPGRPPPSPAQPLPPPCALRPPGRPPAANKPNRGGGGARRGAARRGPGPRSAGRARRRPGGRARPREGRRRRAAPESRRPEGRCGSIGGRIGGREVPFLLFLAAGPGKASWRARLPPGPGWTRLPGSVGGTVAAPPGPGEPELFLGRCGRR